ncbi:hypothetical protein [Armatimonas sp.]|uniref:hypothetical protein n=1 Tax=Armatimonas sp. TaxID=1872638 RepID=UPI002869EF2D|nr:hypothetical protein [Armatimonas sp.]
MRVLLFVGAIFSLWMVGAGCSKPEEATPTPAPRTATAGQATVGDGQMKPAANTLPPPPGFTPK